AKSGGKESSRSRRSGARARVVPYGAAMNEPTVDRDLRAPSVPDDHVDDHLATARFPSMPQMPPPPVRPAQVRPAAVSIARPPWWNEKPRWWWMFLPFMFQSVRQTTAAEDARHDTWLRRRIGFACGIVGVLLIVVTLALGFSSLAGTRFPE